MLNKIALVLTVRTQPGRRAEFESAWERHLRDRAARNDAQQLYLFCRDQNDDDTLRLVEVYSDPDEMTRNASAPWFADYMAEVGPLLAGPPEMVVAEPVWTKGLQP
jgi:quinol monooxygenase YgiN